MKRLLAGSLLLIAAVANASDSCKYDSSYLYFTGRTRVVWGVMEYQCKCGAGHSFWYDNARCEIE